MARNAGTFERQMAYLQNYDVVYLENYNPNNPKQAVITFDDAYSDVVKYALPILEKWNYPFEIFVIGNHIGKSNYFDSRINQSRNAVTWQTGTGCQFPS